MTSRRTIRAASAWLGGALSLSAVAACGPLLTVEGSGQPQTVAIDGDDFDRIEISDAFSTEIVVGPSPASVEITVDDNLTEHLDTGVNGDWLQIGFARGFYDTNVIPTAVISVPSLDELDVSGASQVDVTGVEGNRLVVDASGASQITIGADVTDLKLDLSGASTAEASGSSEQIEIDASGASSADLDDWSSDHARIELSGASTAFLPEVASVEGDLSGASLVQVSKSASESLTTSGRSSVERR